MNSAPGGQVKLRFNKAFGNIDGVNMYCLTQGQVDWRLLGFRKITPFVDDTPLTQPNTVEVRSYRCFGVINDVEIGIVSDTVTVAVI